MTCLCFALRKWWQEGGFLLIRRSKGWFPYPHFMWANKDLTVFSHMTVEKHFWVIKHHYRKIGNDVNEWL